MDRTTQSSQGPVASVVIPTRDRANLLSACLSSVMASETTRPFEVIVVDDGSDPPFEPPSSSVVRVLRTSMIGPGRARNAGWQAATGEYILFADDDVTVSPRWLEAAVEFLERSPGHVGVEGPTESSPTDHLFGYTVMSSTPGAYWTCNVAFRRSVLLKIGGFYDGYPYAHCEDLDLAFRALRHGPIGYATGMCVFHTPREMRLSQIIMRARFAPSEIVLAERFPDRYSRPMPNWAIPILNILRIWRRRTRSEIRQLARSPGRSVRFGACLVGQIGVTVGSVASFELHRLTGRVAKRRFKSDA